MLVTTVPRTRKQVKKYMGKIYYTWLAFRGYDVGEIVIFSGIRMCFLGCDGEFLF